MTAARKVPPPTTRRAPTAGATERCPAVAAGPCDVTRLEVRCVFTNREGASVTRSLFTAKVLRGGSTKGYWIAALLRTHDFVIDVFADYPIGGTPAKHLAKVSGFANYVGAACAGHAHGKLVFSAAGGATYNRVFPGAPRISYDMPGVSAPSIGALDYQRSGKGAAAAVTFFAILKSLFVSASPRLVTVTASACGRRPRGQEAAKNGKLVGLVRVFRKDHWEIKVTVPRLGEFEFKRDKQINTSSATFAGLLKKKSGFKVELSRNGKGIDLGETYEKVSNAIGDLAAALAKIRDFFKKLPQVGWKFTFDIAVLAGSVTLKLGPQLLAAKGRHLPIGPSGSLELKLTIVDLNLKLSFGIDARALDSGLVVTISGSMGIEFGVEKVLTLNASSYSKIPITAKLTGELTALGEVTLVGATLAKGELSAKSGFQLVGGQVLVDLPGANLALKGTVKSIPIVLTGSLIYGSDKTPKAMKPKTLLEGKTLYQLG